MNSETGLAHHDERAVRGALLSQWGGAGVPVSSGTSGHFGGGSLVSSESFPIEEGTCLGEGANSKGPGWPAGAMCEGVLQGRPNGTALSWTWALRGPRRASRDQKRPPRQPGSERLPHRRSGIITVSVTSDFCPFSSNSSNPLSDIRSSRGEGSGQKIEGGAVAPSPLQDPPPHTPPGVRASGKEGRGWGIGLRLKF